MAPVGFAPTKAEQTDHWGRRGAEAGAPGPWRVRAQLRQCRWLSPDGLFSRAFMIERLTRGLSHCDRGGANKEADRCCPPSDLFRLSALNLHQTKS